VLVGVLVWAVPGGLGGLGAIASATGAPPGSRPSFHHTSPKSKTGHKTTKHKTTPTTTTPKTTTPKTTTPQAAKTPKATGNAGAIAFYRKVVSATQAADGVEQIYASSAPLTQVKYSSTGGLSWYVMQPKKAGFAPAVDIVFVGADSGKVTFVADTVLYPGSGPKFPDFGMLLTAKGEVILAGGAPARTTPATSKTTVAPCVGPSKVRFVAGYPGVGVAFGYALYGHFDPVKIVDKGKEYAVTSTYPWSSSPSRTATEVDVVSVATHLPVASQITVNAGGGLPAFTLRWANTWFHSTIYPPRTDGTCAAYTKGVQ